MTWSPGSPPRTSPFEARQTLTYVGLTLDTCGLVYGVDPCEAAIGVTGDQKCLNTIATCQDRLNFDLQDHPEGVAEFVTTLSSTPSGVTVTFSGVAIDPDGSVALTISSARASTGGALSTVTVDGEEAEILVQQDSGNHVRSSVVYAAGPFDGSVEIILTFVSQPDWVRVGVWRLQDAVPVAASGTASNTTSPSPSLALNAYADGSILASVTSYLQSSSAWTGLDEEADASVTSYNYSSAGRGFAADSLAHAISATQTHADRSAPTVVGSGTGFTGSGFAVDDVVILATENQGSWGALPLPGWPRATSGAITDGVTGDLNILYHRMTGTSFTLDSSSFSGDHISATWIVIRGAEKSGNPIAAFATGISAGAVTGITIPSVDTTRVNSLIVDIAAWTADNAGPRYSAWTNANLTGMTERTDAGTASGNGGGTAINTGVKNTVGATGSTTTTCASNNQQFYAKLAINPDFSTSLVSMAAAAFEWTRPIRDTRTSMLFAESSEYRPLGIDAIPSIDAVDLTPAKIDPGESLGSRAVLRVRFKDHRTSDAGDGLDPYFSERAYDPFNQGTFWPKFRARQPFLRNEPITWYQGFVGQELAEMEQRHFIIETFDGPTIDGFYTLVAYDPLKMLDGDRAQCPQNTQGRVFADFNAAAGSFVMTPTDAADEYPASGFVAISGTEIVSYIRSGATFTITRAQMNTLAVDHKAQDRVQLVKQFISMDPADILYDLMVNYAGVPTEWIPLADWQTETAAYLRRNFTARIAEPTPVNRLVSEMMKECGLSIYWDDLSQKIRLRVLRAITTDTSTFDERLFIRERISIREQSEKRFSQVWISYGQINPLKAIEDRDNYRNNVIVADLVSEENYGSAKIKKIYSRFIAEGGSTAATRIGELQLSRYKNPPRLFVFSVARGAQTDPVLGEGYLMSHRILQDAYGARSSVPSQIVQLKPTDSDFQVTMEEFNFSSASEEDLADRTITINSNTYDVVGRSWHDDLYPAPRTGDNITFVIESGITVGATVATATGYAFDLGSWPTLALTGNRTSGSPTITSIADTSAIVDGLRISGTGIPAGATILSHTVNSITMSANATSGTSTSTVVTVALVNITVENRGTISGKGGVGGTGANYNTNTNGTNGEVGGTGLYSRYMFDYVDEGALTQGGGGGGGGGSCAKLDNHRGGGGGGGGGEIAGAGGVGPGNGEEGANGTISAGGAGGRSYTSSSFWSPPSLKDNIRGGNGGAPGVAGQNEVGDYDQDGGNGGAAGRSIDGVSYIKQVGPSGTRNGAQVN